MKKLLKLLTPFIIVGMIIIALAFGIMLLAYLFLFGTILGCLLYAIRWIQNKFQPSGKVANLKNKPGRIIDTDDWKKL